MTRYFILPVLLGFLLGNSAFGERKKQPILFNGDVPDGLLIKATRPKHQQSAAMKAPAPNALPNNVLTVPEIVDGGQFASMAVTMDGIIKSDSVKFLVDNRSYPQAASYFINGQFRDDKGKTPNYARFHYYFAQKHLGVKIPDVKFNNMTYFTNVITEKKFIAGTIQRLEVMVKGVPEILYGIQFYPQDKIAEATLLFAVQQIRPKLKLENARLAVITYGSQQTTITVKSDLAALGVDVLSINDVMGNVPSVPMNSGDAWGYLRLAPPATTETLKPDDIPLFKELPLDLSVVAGVITEAVQDGGSHVNLKSKERNTPNVVIRAPHLLEEARSWADKPIHLIVRADGYLIEPSSKEEVQTKLKEKLDSKPWKKLENQVEWNLLSFDQMAAKNKATVLMNFGYKYGGKAAKLGLLAHRDILGKGSTAQKALDYRLTPLGFGVPMSYYEKVVSLNPELDAKIKALVTAEEAQYGISKNPSAKPLTVPEKIKAIEAIQNGFYKAKLPEDLITKLRTQVDVLKAEAKLDFPKSEIKKVKVRSSANAEDIENFDGAGLHDSYGAKLAEFGDPTTPCVLKESVEGVATKRSMVPETVLCAVRGVYASLWNKRALEERSFAHILPSSAVMGLAINQSYDFRDKTETIDEVANAVVITRVLNTSGIYGYQISLNTDDNLVTNPTPNTQSEINIAAFLNDEKPSYTVIQYAKPVAGEPTMTTSLVSNVVKDRIVNLVRALERAYCQANANYYDNSCFSVVSDQFKKKSLDIEAKIYSNGEVLIKQVREFSGR